MNRYNIKNDGTQGIKITKNNTTGHWVLYASAQEEIEQLKEELEHKKELETWKQ